MRSETEREQLASELDRHVEEEGEILREYHALSDKLADGPLRALVNHIVTEEEMHHFLLRTLSDWLRTPPIPDESLTARGLDRELILRHTRMLRGHERKTVDSCREMKSRLSGAEDDLFGTLLEAIALDSEKHHRLLLTVERIIGE
jgi:rubrerythrin